VIDGPNVDLKRTEYPVEEAVKAIDESLLPERAKEMLAAVYRTGALPPLKSNGQFA
jgi:hypothetical protein